jgi:hypothetical protein
MFHRHTTAFTLLLKTLLFVDVGFFHIGIRIAKAWYPCHCFDVFFCVTVLLTMLPMMSQARLVI